MTRTENTQINLTECSWDDAWMALSWDASDAEFDALIDADGTDSWRAKLAAAQQPSRLIRVSLTRSQSEAVESLALPSQLEELDLGTTYMRGTAELLRDVQSILDGDMMWEIRAGGIMVDLSPGLLDSMERSVIRMIDTIDRKISRATA
tara:strand:- start:382 stop:828 length:447 start_codon:yes stop_codon:yes gene_type:complete